MVRTAVVLVIALLSPLVAPAAVEVVGENGAYQLRRDGRPFFIRGAVGWQHLETLVRAGGNSVRSGPQSLDRAHELGLTVLVNLPMGKPRGGFDYNDRASLDRQKEEVRRLVLRYKDHPAVLMWALGNELEIRTTEQQRVPVWKAVNELARMIHEIDGRHPVLTPIGDKYRFQLGELDRLCPDLDAVGLNAYVDMLTLPEDVARQGWTRPYVVTEFGPRGHWQVDKTPWKVPIEDSSSEKAAFYRRAYEHAVRGRPQCLGSYTFLWSQKMEKTHTWYGMFLPDGAPTEAVDVMSELWKGERPADRAPRIGALKIRVSITDARIREREGTYKAGARIHCTLDAYDPDGDPLVVAWDLRPDRADDPRVGGDFEESVPPIDGAVLGQRGLHARIRLPEEPGNYRIFAYAYDPAGKAATVNLPLRVEAVPKPSVFPVPPPADVSRLGSRIQRTMTLLASSTPERRHRVRILFYGQSITKQSFWWTLADDLRRRFPHADLEIENLAIGGYSSPYLLRTLPQDVYTFYPDLVLFHVYGAEKEYEEIIAGIRRNTTAEIAIQNDHPTVPRNAADPKQAERRAAGDRRSYVFLPRLADKYGCELIDIRRPWDAYLERHGLEPAALLSDNVHLNDHGNYVMAETTKPYLRHDPSIPRESWADLVKTYTVDQDFRWSDGRLEFEFEGNRIDVLAAAGPPARALVLLDGRRPSEIPELYVHLRTTETWGADWPAINRVSRRSPLLAEEWRLRITEASEKAEFLRFEAEGSKTGPDGGGTSRELFVSPSGRVVIEPGDWAIARGVAVRPGPMPEGYAVRWRAAPQFADVYEAPRVADPAREYAVTLAQGLSNARHKLVLEAVGAPAPSIRHIRVYRPPLQ